MCALTGKAPAGVGAAGKAGGASRGAATAGAGVAAGAGAVGRALVRLVLSVAVLVGVVVAAGAAVVAMDRYRPVDLAAALQRFRAGVGRDAADPLLVKLVELARAVGVPLTQATVQGGKLLVAGQP